MSQDSKYIHKSHNVSVLLYHIVSSAKYRQVVFTTDVDQVLIETCKQIELRYGIHFLEIGSGDDHVHFLVQSVPSYSLTKIVRTIKRLIAREVFKHCPDVKHQLWGGKFWGKGYFVNTVGQYGTEEKIAEYVRKQAMEKQYNKLMSDHQLKMFL